MRAVYDGWNRDDFEAVAACLRPDVIWRPSGVIPGLASVYHGREGVRRFWTEMRAAWRDIGITVDRAVAQDGVALFSVTFRGVERRTDAPGEVRFAHVWQLEDGLVARCHAFAGVEEALMRAGELG